MFLAQAQGHTGASALPVFVNKAVSYSNSTSMFSATIPAGNVGDLLVAVTAGGYVTSAPGWQRIQGQNSNGYWFKNVFVRKATGSDTAEFTLQTAAYITVAISRYTSVNFASATMQFYSANNGSPAIAAFPTHTAADGAAGYAYDVVNTAYSGYTGYHPIMSAAPSGYTDLVSAYATLGSEYGISFARSALASLTNSESPGDGSIVYCDGSRQISTTVALYRHPDPDIENYLLVLPFRNKSYVAQYFDGENHAVNGPGLALSYIYSGSSMNTTTYKYYGASLQLDYQGSYLTASHAGFATGTGAFTISGWMQCAGANNYYSLYDSRNAASDSSGIWVGIGASNKLQAFVGATAYSGTTTTSTGVFNHIEVTYNGTTLYGYLNGVLEFSSAASLDLTRTSIRIGGAQEDPVRSTMFLNDVLMLPGVCKHTSGFTPPEQFT